MKRAGTPLLAAVALSLLACSDDPGPEPQPEPADEVVRPANVQPVDLTTTVHTMPESWDAASAWHVAVHPDGRILVGGGGGLYALEDDTVTEIDPTPVRGLLTHPDLGFVVATDDGIFVYDDELLVSALDDMLSAVEVRSVERRADEMWMVTDAELYTFAGDSLVSYPELTSIERLRTHDDAAHLVGHDGAGTVTLLRVADAGLEMQDLGEELEGLVLAAPGPQGRVLGVGADGALFERVPVEGGVAWHAVALSDATDDPGATGVAEMVADPVGGALWVMQDGTLSRLDGNGVVSTINWPAGIASSGRIVATADGAAWLSDGSELLRIGPDAPPPSYENNVVPWYDDNCGNCHEPGGAVATTTRFGDFDGFADQIEIIIEQVDAGLMPAGDEELVGDPDLPRQWRDGGMRP